MITDQKANKQIVGVFLLDGVADGVQIGLTKKPNLFRIFIFKIFLGVKWVDISKLNRK